MYSAIFGPVGPNLNVGRKEIVEIIIDFTIQMMTWKKKLLLNSQCVFILFL